jgi:hypothetical protein
MLEVYSQNVAVCPTTSVCKCIGFSDFHSSYNILLPYQPLAQASRLRLLSRITFLSLNRRDPRPRGRSSPGSSNILNSALLDQLTTSHHQLMY